MILQKILSAPFDIALKNEKNLYRDVLIKKVPRIIYWQQV